MIYILIGFRGLEHNYLKGNIKLFSLIFKDIDKYKDIINEDTTLRANLGLYMNDIYKLYKGLSHEEYSKLLKEKCGNKPSFQGCYGWYGEFLE